MPTPLNIVSTRPSPVTFVSTNVCKCIGVQGRYSIVQTEFFNVQPEAYRTAETTATRYRVNVLRFDLDKAGGSFSFLVTWYNRHHKHLQTPPLWSLQHFFSCPCSCTRSGTHCHIGPHLDALFIVFEREHPRPFLRKTMINPPSVPLTMNHGRINLLYP